MAINSDKGQAEMSVFDIATETNMDSSAKKCKNTGEKHNRHAVYTYTKHKKYIYCTVAKYTVF